VPASDSAFRLDGKIALVTGAGRGIGRAIALALASAGAELILNSRTPVELDAVADDIASRGGRARVLPFDVTDSAAVRAAIAGLSGLDILVNNAGMNRPQPFFEVDEATLDRLIALNIKASFIVAQAAARLMVDGAGVPGRVIVNMSSQMGHVGSERDRTVYVMTKHAVEGLTKAMAVELAPSGVRVVSIAPTFITTPLTEPFFANPEFRQWVVDRIPLGRIGTVEEVANAVVFLASPAASLVTGSSLLVDGGWTAW
jgi:NAD(P)-dependent dehydrogenase (short-subunit alcohol dehydrogenase family)